LIGCTIRANTSFLWGKSEVKGKVAVSLLYG